MPPLTLLVRPAHHTYLEGGVCATPNACRQYAEAYAADVAPPAPCAPPVSDPSDFTGWTGWVVTHLEDALARPPLTLRLVWTSPEGVDTDEVTTTDALVPRLQALDVDPRLIADLCDLPLGVVTVCTLPDGRILFACRPPEPAGR